MEEIKPKVIDELLKGYQEPEDLIGENGLLKQLRKAVLERALNAELTHHLGMRSMIRPGHNSGKSRNGTSAKTVKGRVWRAGDGNTGGIATAHSSHRYWASARGASMVSMTRFCRCTRGV